MNDLPPVAVEHLYPVLVILALAFGALVSLIGGLWVGFRWLKGQIRETAQEIVTPVAEKVSALTEKMIVVEKSVDAAHRRIDTYLGART